MPEAFYRSVLERAPFGAIVSSTRLDGPNVYLNPEFTRITGYELDDIPKVQDWIECAYPDPAYRQEVLGNWSADTSPDQMNRDVVYRVRCRDGATKHVQFRAAMVKTDRMVVMLLDVTGRERTEQALRESEERYRVLVESSPQGIVLHSAGKAEFANAAAAQIMNVDDPHELLGKPVIEFVHPDWRETVMQRMRAVLENGTPALPDEERWVRPDGSFVDLEVAGGPVQFRGRRVSQVVFTDITVRKQMEQERRALQQRVQRAQLTESLALLAGGVAHDLNNLLVGVLGRAELVRLAADDPAARAEHVDAIVEASKRAADLAGQLLSYAGRRPLAFEQVDLDALISDTKRLLEATAGKRASLHLELAGDLPSLTADTTQLRQILLNLVTNAAEALAATGGHISIATRRLGADDSIVLETCAPSAPVSRDYVLLEVADDGPGLDAATRERVFDPFFTTKAAGRGLGLAAVLGIVRGHQGVITVAGAPGEGTRFRVLFPASGSQKAPRPPRAAEKSWRGHGTALIVDDEPVVLEVGAAMLEELGFEVEMARDGSEALAIVERAPSRLACVILDLTMPGLDGEETLRGIHALRADLPVILSSGFDEADTAPTARGWETSGFLKKPYTFASLTKVLRDIIG